MFGKPAGILGSAGCGFVDGAMHMQKHGEAGLTKVKSIPKNPANQPPAEIVVKVLYQRRKYHLGPLRIIWYLARYHGLNRLPRGTRMRNGQTPYEALRAKLQ